MTKKLHLVTGSGEDQSGERYSSSACGLNEDSDADWDGTGVRDKVTCKRCLKQMAKPKKPSTFELYKERPILFSAPMVRAILEGRKTVTRRPLKGHQIPRLLDSEYHEHRWMATVQNHPRWGFGAFGATEAECVTELAIYGGCPYGRCGDRMWVRETTAEDCLGSISTTTYTADGAPSNLEWWYSRRSCPSIHMPRVACRMLLEITDVRVERLQDISEEQAMAEGVGAQAIESFRAAGVDRPAGFAFRDLWTSINGDENWTVNPWVWVVEFKQVTP